MCAGRVTPKGFFCPISGQVMVDPVFHTECGRLFDQKSLAGRARCPDDGKLIINDALLPFQELKEKIASWSVAPLTRSWASMTLRGQAVDARRSALISRVCNVHQDDVHCLNYLTPGLFISGSKDCTVKIWDHQAQCQKELGCERQGRGYKSWITAIEVFKDGSWIYGRRDGQISIQNKNHERVKSYDYSPSREDHQCKNRNKLRINCLRENPNDRDETQVYIGTATKVQLWSVDQGKVLKSHFASKNDWVYDVQILDEDRILVVIGSNLELWNTSFNPRRRTFIIQETEEQKRSRQRPHISSLAKLSSNPALLAAALFDGTVQIIDLHEGKAVKAYSEHIRRNIQVNRVWKVIDLAPNIFASSADDAKIKIWDIRQRQSIHTLEGNPGRVSNLLKLDETAFVSASCPDNLRSSAEKASFAFWNLRMLLPTRSD